VLDQAYELPANRVAPWVTAAASAGFLALAANGATEGHTAFVAVALAVAATLATLAVASRWHPHRVVLTDAGVVLHSSAKDTVIPWQELAAILVAVGRHRRLTWVRADGSRTDTFGLPPGHHDLLTEVRHRAPHVRVVS
jgi:hypothetical protein